MAVDQLVAWAVKLLEGGDSCKRLLRESRVAWFGSFLTGASIWSFLFMPIFVEQLGIEGDQVAFYAD